MNSNREQFELSEPQSEDVELEIEDIEEEDEGELGKDNLGDESYKLLPYIRDALSLKKDTFNRLEHRLWCFSAKVRQPKKDDGTCNKTPLCYRWNTNSVTSHLISTDPRYATQEECQKVFATLLAMATEADGLSISSKIRKIVEEILGREFRPKSLSCVETGALISAEDIRMALSYATAGLSSYEIPVTYITELNSGGQHIQTNVGWMKPIHVSYKLRAHLRKQLQKAGVNARAIKTAFDKIQVKAYCTDKVTMPPYYSNRDVRWVTWTDSIQYASHYECARVELELMSQLYEFLDAPALESSLASEVEAIRGVPIQPGSHKCFVIGKLLSYSDYVEAAKKPKGGRSRYHVGHIFPLTRGGRHVCTNIAWASDDGNRIQGNDTQEEIEAKLVEAVTYHLQRDIDRDTVPEYLIERVGRLWEVLSQVREQLESSRE